MQFCEKGIFCHEFPFYIKQFAKLLQKTVFFFKERVATFMSTGYTFY